MRCRTVFSSVVLAVCLLPALARSATISFEGDFTSDDSFRGIFFYISATSDVVIYTLSYSGGINAAGQTIAPGGFAPVLSLFTVQPANPVAIEHPQPIDFPMADLAFSGAHPDSGDAVLVLSSLPAGGYILVITEYDNQWNSPSETYTRFGEGNFTGVAGCAEGMFCDLADPWHYGQQRTSHWALDISGVDEAEFVPEPAAFWLCGAGMAALAVLCLRRRQHVRPALVALRSAVCVSPGPRGNPARVRGRY
jgi:hypothetical protein